MSEIVVDTGEIEMVLTSEEVEKVVEIGPPGPRGTGLPTGWAFALNDDETALVFSVDGVPHSQINLYEIP